MTCMCEPDADNPCTADPVRPDRRTPLTVVTVDLATLAGLLSNPAHLGGHGIIDADYARELADNTQWQLLLTEARALVEHLGHSATLESLFDADSGPGANVGTESRQLVFHPLGRGRRRAGGSLPRPPRSQKSVSKPRSSCAGGPYRGTYTLVAELEEAIAADPRLGLALHPDGHGGLELPPPGALVYRPSAALAALVRHRDRTCRHPGCDVPAERCEIDHLVSFLHRDPIRGGWTIGTNLHCLCRYHHGLKTMGLWIPVSLGNGIDYWTSSSGTNAITLPGSAGSPPSGHHSGTTVPRIAAKPRGAAVPSDPVGSLTPGGHHTPAVSDEEPPPF